MQEQVLSRTVSEGVLSQPIIDERLARKNILRGFVLESLEAIGVGDLYQIRERIDQLHPVTRKHWWESKNNATPKEVWQTLVELQLGDIHLKCETIDGDIDSNKPARFLWSREEELTQ